MTITRDRDDTLAAGDEGRLPSSPAASIASWSRLGWLVALSVACGAIAASANAGQTAWPLALAMSLLLALAWLVLWIVIAQLPWAAALASWDTWTEGRPLRRLPYARPDSDAARASLRFGQLREWFVSVLWPRHGVALSAGAAALAVTAVLASALGAAAVLLTLLAVCLPQIALVACQGNGRPHPLLQGFNLVTLPLLLGYFSLAPVGLGIVPVAVGLGLLVAGTSAPAAVLRHAGYAIALATLLATRQSVGAFMLAVLWVPQLLLPPVRLGWVWSVLAMLTVAFTFAQ